MNKKGEAFSTLQKAFIAIVLLGIGVVVVLMITGVIHPFKNCPKEDCLSSCGKDTMNSGKKCSEDELICCQSIEGVLGVQKKKTDGTPSAPTSATNQVITINLNAEIKPLSTSSTQTLYTGQVYNFKIGAKGAGSNYCNIQLIDTKSKNKVTDWVVGASEKADCQKAVQTITLSPTSASLMGGSYQLEVEVYNDTQRNLAYSVIYINTAASS